MAYNKYNFRLDPQAKRLYKAEDRVICKDGPSPHLRSIDQCVAWIEIILNEPWFKRNFKVREVEIIPGRGQRNAVCRRKGAERCQITLPRWARTYEVLLHELAHACCQKRPGHGPEFAGTYIYLVEQVMGRQMAKQLRAQFRKKNVKWKRDPEIIPKP
jgi:putative metallohydrolase (TIGR04338 family)